MRLIGAAEELAPEVGVAQACEALGVSRATYAEWLRGKSRTTGKPVAPSRTVALACAALAAGLEPWVPASIAAE